VFEDKIFFMRPTTDQLLSFCCVTHLYVQGIIEQIQSSFKF